MVKIPFKGVLKKILWKWPIRNSNYLLLSFFNPYTSCRRARIAQKLVRFFIPLQLAPATLPLGTWQLDAEEEGSPQGWIRITRRRKPQQWTRGKFMLVGNNHSPNPSQRGCFHRSTATDSFLGLLRQLCYPFRVVFEFRYLSACQITGTIATDQRKWPLVSDVSVFSLLTRF